MQSSSKRTKCTSLHTLGCERGELLGAPAGIQVAIQCPGLQALRMLEQHETLSARFHPEVWPMVEKPCWGTNCVVDRRLHYGTVVKALPRSSSLSPVLDLARARDHLTHAMH
eukprot:6434190-Amphidinium_carterae.1